MFFFLLMTAAAAGPQTIHFESPNRSFDLVLTVDHLALREGRESQVIKISGCNSELVKGFWQSTTAQVRNLPKAPNGKFKPWLSYEGRFYFLPPKIGRGGRSVHRLDAKFATFASKEQRLCGPKRS